MISIGYLSHRQHVFIAPVKTHTFLEAAIKLWRKKLMRGKCRGGKHWVLLQYLSRKYETLCGNHGMLQKNGVI